MKRAINLILFILLMNQLPGQSIIEHLGISQTGVDLSSTKILGQITINPAVSGNVLVSFDGSCWSSPGDRIILAASNTTSWGINDGHTEVEAINADLRLRPFSHTRVYNVSPGSRTFYAIGYNGVETDGTGIASIYGSLTVQFFPASNSILGFMGIIKSNIDLTSNTTVGSVTINPTVSGKAIVKFDGFCISDPGDRIVLAASNTTSWGINDGAVGVESYNSDINQNSFSHTRVYDVSPGTRTFYAVAQNYVETAGSGFASIYGSLTVEFIPSTGYIVAYSGIQKTNVNLSSSTVLAQVAVNPSVSGKVLVRFDGNCISSPGDLIVLAASNSTSWGVNDGNVGVEAVNSDVNRNSFSHTRLYSVSPGSRTYYAIGQNYVETAGDGIASIYGSLTAIFIPDIISGKEDLFDKELISIYPNPTDGVVHIANLTESVIENGYLNISDAMGKTIQIQKLSDVKSGITYLSRCPDGIYYFQIIDSKNSVISNHKIVKVNR